MIEPKFDGFRNYKNMQDLRSTEALLVDRPQLLTLKAPQMTVLVGGLRVLGAISGGSRQGVWTDNPGTLSSDFFTNLLDQNIEWKSIDDSEEVFEGRDRATGVVKWTGTRADLVFGSNSILLSLAEIYASSDSSQKFAMDFVAAWNKAMNLDRFDVKSS